MWRLARPFREALLNFEPQLGRAVDQGTGLNIVSPRMFSSPTPDMPDHVEYEYSYDCHRHLFYGVGLLGLMTNSNEFGRRRCTHKLGLGGGLEFIFRLKRMLNNADEDFAFLQAIAQGLVRVFEKDINRAGEFLYQALVCADSLAERGISHPSNVTRLPTGEILLAEVFVAIHVEKATDRFGYI
jgi:hypothetical protein